MQRGGAKAASECIPVLLAIREDEEAPEPQLARELGVRCSLKVIGGGEP